MAQDKRMVEGYEVIQSVRLDGFETIVAENRAAEKPYMCWRRSVTEEFGVESHMIPIFDRDYVKIMKEFAETITHFANSLEFDRVYRGSWLMDLPLDQEDCVPDGLNADLKDKVIAVKAEFFAPEYRTLSHQLYLANGGFGCSPTARGRTVFATNIYDMQEQARFDRGDILGVLDEKSNRFLQWARENVARMRQPEQKSVIAAIEASKTKPPQKRQPKSRASKEEEL